MMYRSWLVVPAHNEKRLFRAVGSGADAIVLDLVDADPLAGRRPARQQAVEWLHAHRAQVTEHKFARWVRINPFDNGAEWREDLLAVMPAAPDGIVLPRAAGPDAVRQLAAELYEIEQRCQVAANSTHIIPMVAQSAQAALATPQYAENGHQRIFGLGWDADTLAADIGATRIRGDAGVMTEAFRFGRAQTLLTAHACGLLALDTLAPPASDGDEAPRRAAQARADGFSGLFVSHPGQVAAVNEAFTPSANELRNARDIVAAFDANSGGSAPSLHGHPLPASNLRLAQRTLGQVHGPAHRQSELQSTLRPA